MVFFSPGGESHNQQSQAIILGEYLAMSKE